MTFHWLLTGAAVLLAGAAFAKARRLAKRLERLTESYWELRYEQGQIGARITRLEKGSPVGGGEPAVPVAERPPAAFVPLSSLRKS